MRLTNTDALALVGAIHEKVRKSRMSENRAQERQRSNSNVFEVNVHS